MTQESDRRQPGSADLDAAARKLQEAVEDAVATATGEMADSVTASLDEATARLRGQRRSRRDHRRKHRRRSRRFDAGVDVDIDVEGKDRERRGAARSALRNRARAYRDYEHYGRRSRKLYLDDENGKIVGVCGGIANYFGMEAWVVRVIAVTGLIFMPSIVFPAYWVAYFVMDYAPDAKKERKRDRKRRAGRRAPDGPARAAEEPREVDHSAPAPEIGMRFSPRRSLRATQDDFVELELRLRRIETHVTSGQFELQRELHRIDD